jgi:SAM-dependent methyltransferase
MSTPDFDFDEVFSPDDYLYFYELRLGSERTEDEVGLIQRLLGLEPGMAVLDLACGHGRITQGLAAHGCHVVGLDASPGFLSLARQAALVSGREGDTAPEYILGDMRRLPWSERFDAVVNWFTAYGYFDDDQNRSVLREVQRALKPGGKLLIELNNRDYVLSHLQPALVIRREDSFMIDQSRYDVATGRMLTDRTIIRNGHVRTMQFFVRMFTFPELRDWLLAAGFARVEGFDERGAPLALESRRMLVMAVS